MNAEQRAALLAMSDRQKNKPPPPPPPPPTWWQKIFRKFIMAAQLQSFGAFKGTVGMRGDLGMGVIRANPTPRQRLKDAWDTFRGRRRA